MKTIRTCLSICISLLFVSSICIIPTAAASVNTRIYRHDYYSVSYNSEMDETWSTLAAYLDTAETLLYNNFNINLDRLFASSSSALNQRDGCTRGDSVICSTSCGALSTCYNNHHKAGYYFLDQADASDAKVFRFVDFAICRYKTSSSVHGEIYGAASGDDSDIIVSLCSPTVQRTTVHELSHWYGARDNQCVSGQDCVMRYGTSVYNKWCDNCEEDINNYLLGF